MTRIPAGGPFGSGRRHLMAIAGMSLLSAARGTVAAETSPVRFFDPAFAAAVKDPQAILGRERPAIELPRGGSINSCRGLLERKDVAEQAVGATSDRRFADYQACFAIGALQRARAPEAPVSKCYAEPDSCVPAQILKDRLDLTSFPNSLRPRTFRKSGPVSFEKLGVEAALTARFSLTAEIPDWIFQVDALAAADFDGEHREQWLLHLIDRATVGSYFSTGYLIASGIAGDGPVTARWLGA